MVKSANHQALDTPFIEIRPNQVGPCIDIVHCTNLIQVFGNNGFKFLRIHFVFRKCGMIEEYLSA